MNNSITKGFDPNKNQKAGAYPLPRVFSTDWGIADAAIGTIYDTYFPPHHKGVEGPRVTWQMFLSMLADTTPADRFTVAVSKLAYQVDNGGFAQWVENGYWEYDAEMLIYWLEKGALGHAGKLALNILYDVNDDVEESGWDCPHCGGSGMVEVEATCGECAGDGYFIDEDDEEIECGMCFGSGSEIVDELCWECNGDGQLNRKNNRPEYMYDTITTNRWYGIKTPGRRIPGGKGYTRSTYTPRGSIGDAVRAALQSEIVRPMLVSEGAGL